MKKTNLRSQMAILRQQTKDEKDLQMEKAPKVDSVNTNPSNTQSANPVNKISDSESLPSQGSDIGNVGNSPSYKSFDLPFAAIIPQ